MRVDYVHGVRPWLCSGEPTGELVHGTGYHDRIEGLSTASLGGWLKRYPDAKVNNRMSRHAMRCRTAFHVLRDMPETYRATTQGEAHEQAARVVVHLLNWLAAP